MQGITANPKNTKLIEKIIPFLEGRVRQVKGIEIIPRKQTILSMSQYFVVLSIMAPNIKDPIIPDIMNIPPNIALSIGVYPYGAVKPLTTAPKEVQMPQRNVQVIVRKI